jgi:ornithine cyclodeaminase
MHPRDSSGGPPFLDAAAVRRPVPGSRLAPGTHVDLVGSFRPDMREADSEVLVRARVFVDSREGALAEAGELLHAIAQGRWSADRIEADLAALCRGEAPGRTSPPEITLFKAVGTALADLATASLVADSHAAGA